jgi:hypothetical protein
VLELVDELVLELVLVVLELELVLVVVVVDELVDVYEWYNHEEPL